MEDCSKRQYRKKINVCVYPAQNEGAVEINNALSNCEDITVYGVTSIRGHNEYNFKNYFSDMPPMESVFFLPEFNRFLKEKEIDVVFPTSDPVVAFLADHQDDIPVKIANCDLKSATICNNKLKTYDLFKDCDFCPEVYTSFDKFPCFIKPVEGEGALGAKLIAGPDDIPNSTEMENCLILEYLPGKEVTVDCFTDCDGEMTEVLPRSRDKIFSGMCVSGETIRVTEEIIAIANTINERLTLRGLWYFQIKQNSENKFRLLEISMRCAGTMCQSRSRGYNLPLLTVYTVLGQKARAIENDYTVILDRTLFARYKTNLDYEYVYVDYDGTIIVKNKVCLPVIRFLYQCKNNNKKIALITRHNADHDNTVYEDMEKFGISQFLFDEIHCLPLGEEKYSVITQDKSLFIDNSYVERKKVHDARKIPVFGVDAVDVLQDWRL